ncbi:MAG: OPT/YSL family transporter, partial [Bacteroidota bacterium]
LVGAFIAITVELCGVKALSFAVGLYLPLSTTLPIFCGGAIKGIVEWRAKRKNEQKEDEELGKGSLFATGLVAGGALAGVIVALLSVDQGVFAALEKVSALNGLTSILGESGFMLLGTGFFAYMGWVLYRLAVRK